MRAGLIVSGVLTLGTALTFGAAALVASAFPNGTTVAAGFNNTFMDGKGPMPAPAILIAPPAVGDPSTDNGKGLDLGTIPPAP